MAAKRKGEEVDQALQELKKQGRSILAVPAWKRRRFELEQVCYEFLFLDCTLIEMLVTGERS
jgi:hypothetical protein